MDLGSGKVAGKVLIVDHYNGHAKILILLETVIEWCCVQASNISHAAPFSFIISSPLRRDHIRVSILACLVFEGCEIILIHQLLERPDGGGFDHVMGG